MTLCALPFLFLCNHVVSISIHTWMVSVALSTVSAVVDHLDLDGCATPNTKTLTTLVVNGSLQLYFVHYFICETIQAKVAHVGITRYKPSVVCLIQAGFLPAPFQSNSIALFNKVIPNVCLGTSSNALV